MEAAIVGETDINKENYEQNVLANQINPEDWTEAKIDIPTNFSQKLKSHLAFATDSIAKLENILVN